MCSQAPNASFSGTCETAKHHVFQVPNSVKKTQPLTSLSEDLKTMYSQAPKASSWGTCETAKHHIFQVSKGVKNPASNVTFWRRKDNVQSSAQSLVLNVQSSTQSLVLGHLRNSQAPWGTCETAKHHVFQVSNGVKNTAYRQCTVKHPMSRSPAPAKQPNTMYFRSQTAWKTQPLTSFSEDLKTMYNQAPKASFSAACETAKHHVFQVPKGVKNTASNVTFWRPKDNVQSSTQSLVLGHLRNSQTPCIWGPKRRQKHSL